MIDWDQAVLGPLLAVFGEADPPTYYPRVGLPFAIDGVFDEAYREVAINGDGAPMNTTSPVLGIRLAQFAGRPDPTQGDRVKIASARSSLTGQPGAMFVVRNVEPDGHGWAFLRLQETR